MHGTMAVKPLVKISGPDMKHLQSKAALARPSLRPIFGPKAIQKTVFMIRTQSN
jgi:hypothetical protein